MTNDNLAATLAATVGHALTRARLNMAEQMRAAIADTEARAAAATTEADRQYHAGVRAGIVYVWVNIVTPIDL